MDDTVMKAFQLEGRFGIDALSMVERPEPVPGYREVMVRVKAVSLNYRDLLTVKGAYARGAISLPRIPCSDGAGEVVKVGEGVTRVSAGERVAGIFMQHWLAGAPRAGYAKSALGGAVDGMLSEYVVLHEDGLVRAPEHLSDEEAATLPCAAVTAWRALVTRGGLSAGQTVLVLGSGGVSVFALQFARLLGARVIVTSSSDRKLARLRELGASDGINYKTHAQWERAVLDLTGGVGVDHVVEVGGAGTLAKSLQAVRFGGCVSLIGVLTGVDGEINPVPVLLKSLRLEGIYVGSREDFEEMNRAISLHRLRPVIDRVFPFEQSREALRYMESAAHLGKIVIRIQ